MEDVQLVLLTNELKALKIQEVKIKIREEQIISKIEAINKRKSLDDKPNIVETETETKRTTTLEITA
jgi:hypothetical protein